MRRLVFILASFFPFFFLEGQETIINLSISQPRELKVNAGADVITESGTVTLGSNLQVSGGTPDFSFLWLLNENIIASDRITQVSHSGKYVVKVIDSRNCSATDTVSVFFTSVEEVKSNLPCKVFPVPTSNLLTIEVPDDVIIQSVSIVAIDGTKLSTIGQPQKGSNNSVKTDVSFLPDGFYFLSVLTSGSGCIIPFVKN